jgi:hypothetical protein
MAREYSKAIARLYPDDWATHKKRSLSASGTSACLTLTETDHRIAVDIDALDAHPWELNTPGGIINLRTGQLRPPDPIALHTRSTRVAPDPDADQTPWLEFLATTFQEDQAIIGYIRRLMGYACVGEVREAILPVFYGQGANGKTVLLETVQAVLGDYAIGKPIVIEETFPLHCSQEEFDEFLRRSRGVAAGWIGHYFGRTIAEHRATAGDRDAAIAAFLESWRHNAP